ncbi:NAP family protein-like protein [Xylogone sp. PMI_703]|nr:NAP family protein-like protein [Xylogone sp. PMI_703]
MAAALEETPVSYEDLADIEREFDDVETEIIRQQVTLTAPLYVRRQQTVSQIPNFWPLVLEQAPPDIDQYIQPSDSALLLSSLISLSVTHFELDDPKGDPRSVAIKWQFAPNDYFEDQVLEKKFWYRRAPDGWAGLVSEPVKIEWKKGKDLTGGLSDLVYNAWGIEQKENAAGKKKEEGKRKKELTPEQKALKKKIENTGMGGLSFFAWFGYIGRRVTAEESLAATEKERQERQARKDGKQKAAAAEDKLADEDEEDEEEDIDLSLEIFPDGDELALAITDDLWPGAIKYFTQAQEQDALSDADFESDDLDSDDEAAINSAPDSAGEDEPPTKKRRSS